MESSVQPSTRMTGGGMTGRNGRNGCYCNPKKNQAYRERTGKMQTFIMTVTNQTQNIPISPYYKESCIFSSTVFSFLSLSTQQGCTFISQIRQQTILTSEYRLGKKNLPGVQTISKGLSKNISEGNDLSCWLDLSTVSLQRCDRFWEPPWFFSGLTQNAATIIVIS